jgi:RNase P/RNase MRP subunit POP5
VKYILIAVALVVCMAGIISCERSVQRVSMAAIQCCERLSDKQVTIVFQRCKPVEVVQ